MGVGNVERGLKWNQICLFEKSSGPDLRRTRVETGRPRRRLPLPSPGRWKVACSLRW